MSLGTLLLHLLIPLMAADVAQWGADHGWGLLNHIDGPMWVEALVAIVLLDMGIYWQHRLFHQIPLLWAIHRVHHTDQEVDVSTAVRFHPIEIVLSMIIKFGFILLIGPASFVVIFFEVLLNFGALFSHANLALPKKWDAFIRWGVVTPDMHRIHHSSHPFETNSNYGFFLACWDRLFQSYRSEPLDGYDQMLLGLNGIKGDRTIYLLSLLREPFYKKK